MLYLIYPYTVGIPEVDMTYAGLVHYKDKGTKDKKDTILCIYMYVLFRNVLHWCERGYKLCWTGSL